MPEYWMVLTKLYFSHRKICRTFAFVNSNVYSLIAAMADVIQLLPEHVANQIAAGEVVQRPASVVKELLENAVDAGATRIQLIVKEAGKSLIQVIDNGCGMSETDARMSFERHATSKIREAKDLFSIRTMGFRGEALASIAAVAQVELRTRRATDELGTRLVLENSTVMIQEACQCEQGTSLAVKNLFFNVPARRSFLKGESVELRHIFDEFQRVALVNPDIAFSLHHNDQEVYRLQPGNMRQRIVKLFGDTINPKLIPAQQDTDVLKISGFVGKPEAAKKTRGEQFFFVNGRFIKSSYLHYAVMGAYEGLLPPDQHPMYFLILDIDPHHVDINVHPTKQEIKFDDEKLVSNLLRVCVRHALGTNNVTPSLDFDQEPAFRPTPVATPTLKPAVEPAKATVGSGGSTRSSPPVDKRHADNLRNWQRLYEGLDMLERSDVPPANTEATPPTVEVSAIEGESVEMAVGSSVMVLDDAESSFSKIQKEPYQLHQQYIVSQIRSGFILIDQQAASERILYERYLDALAQQPMSTQAVLFPKSMELSASDAALLLPLLPTLNQLGFDIASFGGNAFVIHGVPAELGKGMPEEGLVEQLLHQYKENVPLNLGIHENIARSMARSAAIRRGRTLNIREMQDLIDQLFACEVPYRSPFGRSCFITIELDELQKRFA
jgi:DNA mismatch repair protein MutL